MGNNPWDFSDIFIAGDEQRSRNKERESIGALRNLQMEEIRAQMKERQGFANARAGWSPYMQANRGLLEPTTTTTQQPMSQEEIGASVGTGVGPIVSKDVSTTIPAKESYESLSGKYWTEKGYPEKGLPLMKEARQERQGNAEGISKMLTAIGKLKGDNQKNAIELMRTTYPETKDWKFSEDTNTGIKNMTVPTADGNWHFAFDESGEKVAQKFVEKKEEKEKEFTVKGHSPAGNPVSVSKDGQQYEFLPSGEKRVYRGRLIPLVDRIQTEKDSKPTAISELKKMRDSGEITPQQYKQRLLSVPGLFNVLQEEGGNEPLPDTRPSITQPSIAQPKKVAPPPLKGKIVSDLPPASSVKKGTRAFDTVKKIWIRSDGKNWVSE